MTNRFIARPLSYSQLSSFEWSPDEWYASYILGRREPPNDAMLLGTKVGDSIGTPESLVPTLTPPGVKEYAMRASLGDIHMVGFADHYCVDSKVLHENKTTDKPGKWTQASVDKHKQLDMYALLLWLQDKTPPHEVEMFLNYIPVERKGVTLRLPAEPVYYQFPTYRTRLQVAQYASYVKRTVKEMDKYIKARKSLGGLKHG